jgi:uncharacterized membrane protein YoaK (UPF0700 family)
MKSGDISSRIGLALLAITSGSSDVIAFLLLGHVFASAMTGNTALLGIALSDGNLVAVTQPFSALFGFAAGVVLATVVCNSESAPPRRKPILRSLLVLEAACLSLFAITWELGPHLAGEPTHYLMILLCSVAMGTQGVVAKELDTPGVNAIVFTTTLVTIVSSAVGILSKRIDDSAVRSATIFQTSAFAAYGAGAMLAGLLYWAEFALLAWLPLTAIVVVLATQKNQ